MRWEGVEGGEFVAEGNEEKNKVERRKSWRDCKSRNKRRQRSRELEGGGERGAEGKKKNEV